MSEHERRRWNIKVSFVLTLISFILERKCSQFEKKRGDLANANVQH